MMTRNEIIDWLTGCENVQFTNRDWDRHHPDCYWQSQYGLTDDQVFELEAIGDRLEKLFRSEFGDTDDPEPGGCSNELIQLSEQYETLFDKYVKSPNITDIDADAMDLLQRKAGLKY